MFEVFDKSSEKQWLDQLTAEQNNNEFLEKSLYSLLGVTISPFAHEASEHYLLKRTNENWDLGTAYDIEDSSELNRKILESLALDVSHLSIRHHDNLDYDTVFNGVISELVSVEITGLTETTPNLTKPFREVFFPYMANGSHTAKSIRLGLHDGFVDEVTRTLDILQSIQWSEVLLSADCHSNFYANIVGLRALRVIMEETFPGRSIKLKLSISQSGDSFEKELIRCTPLFISGILGVADIIEIVDVAPQPEFNRLSKMIHHLSQYEAHLSLVEDPLSGSHFIEKVTATLISAVSEFKNEK